MSANRGLFDVLRGGQIAFAEIQAQDAVHGHGDLGQFTDARARHHFHAKLQYVAFLIFSHCRAL